MLVSQINANGGFSGVPAATDAAANPRPAVTETARTGAAAAELPAKAVQGAAAVPDAEQVKQAVEHVNKMVQSMTNDLKFTVDEDTGIQVVKVMDTRTKDVIRQIPSEEVVAIAKALDQLQGLIIRQKA